MTTETPEPDLKVGDFVYAVYNRGLGKVELEMQRAQVKSIGKTIRLSSGGLAFGCRSQFDLADLGKKFDWTPALALALFHADQKREEEFHLQAAEKARKLQEVREYINGWEKQPGW